MRTDFYRNWESLLSPTDLAKGPLLLIAPHPDDEVLGAGGLVIGHRDAGQDVRVVVMTDGRLGDATGKYGDDYPDIRKAEHLRAAEKLGGAKSVFLDFPDFGMTEAMASEVQEPVERLVEQIREEPWATIAFPSPYELHPDHRATGIAALAAAVASGTEARLLAYEVGSFMPSNLLIDITSRMERKQEALACYGSQIEHHDLPVKMDGLGIARSANVDDKAVTHCEAYLKIDAEDAEKFLEAVERLLRMTDQMAPVIPYE